MSTNKNEIEYLAQDILPLLAQSYNFPQPDDHDRVKIQHIPVRMGSGIKKPDVVYYWDDVSVFVIEAKRTGKSESEAVDQALSYIRNFPVESYSKNGIKPRFFAVTIGKQVNFYAHRFEIEGNNFKDWAEKLSEPVLFSDLLREYGLKKIEKKEILTPEVFRKEVLNELGPLYKFEEKITPDVVKNVALQVLSFLEYSMDFVSHRPYVNIEKHKDRQAQIRQVFEKFDWQNSLRPEIAKEFRSYILRSFQGTNLNQYLTEQCVIAFMVNLAGDLKPETKVLDFECGSGGFLAALIDKGVDLENIRGIDIDELPYIIAKTYLALYFKKTGKDEIDSLPVKLGNGLFYQGDDWDLVIGNPAGGSQYEHGDLEKIGLEGLINLKNSEHNYSEYELSIQQAIRSLKVSGKLCLILPEGFFSNSQDEFLRKFVAKYCKALAIIGLPRGSFKRGTSTKQQQSGTQTSPQKMSILYAQKVREIDKEYPIGEIDLLELDYPIFLASIGEPESKSGQISDWLDPGLGIVSQQWQEWQNNHQLKSIPKIEIKIIEKTDKKKSPFLPLFEEKDVLREEIKSKIVETKTKTKISKFLKDLFS